MTRPVFDLRARLRAGDPYDGTPMAEADATRIRARLRTAAGEPAAAAAPFPYFRPVALAATLLLTLGVWLYAPVGTLRDPATRPGPAESPAATPEPPTSTEPPFPSWTPTVHAAPAVPERLVAAASDPAESEVATSAPDPAATLVATTDPAPVAEARNLRLTAPGGTRIIWTLDPEFETDVARSSARRPIERQGAMNR